MGTVLDDIAVILATFVENYGWPTVISIVALYYASPTIAKYFQSRSLAEANDPKRKKILTADMKKARVRQGLEYYRSLRKKNEGRFPDVECGDPQK